MLFRRPRPNPRSLTAVLEAEREAISSVERAVDVDPTRAGLLAEMIAECRRRAAARPDDGSWHFLQGRLLMAAGDAMEAREELEVAAMLRPRDVRVTAHLALWYEAALMAATGANTNVELPEAAGPEISANAARFAKLDEPLAVDEIAGRALKLFEAALRYKLPAPDVRFLRRHVADVRDRALSEDVRIRHRRLLRAV